MNGCLEVLLWRVMINSVPTTTAPRESLQGIREVAPDTFACAILMAHRHPLEGLNFEALAVLWFGERS